MSLKPFISASSLIIFSFVMLNSTAFSQDRDKSSSIGSLDLNTHIDTNLSVPSPTIAKAIALDIKSLTETASVILIAQVIDMPQSPKTQGVPAPFDPKINLQKELDRAREGTKETARKFTGFNFGVLVYFNTIETLKGPQTKVLSLPNIDADLKDVMPGDLFLIMMGTNHPDAIRPISSIEDLWVEHIKTVIRHQITP